VFLVVGGGVGGLTAAATFARQGVEVVLIERRPAFDIPGVGLGQPAKRASRLRHASACSTKSSRTGFSYDSDVAPRSQSNVDRGAQIPDG